MRVLSNEEQAIIRLVAQFVDERVRPVVKDFEHADTYPDDLIEQMKAMGLFGLLIPEPWGGGRVSTACFARVTVELARGWMSLSGAMGGHSVVSQLILEHGTRAQKDRYLPMLATGRSRASMALTEPGGGSDLQAMRTVARSMGDKYVINGSKVWITNARRSNLTALLCKTDPHADPPSSGISVLLVEKGPGFEISHDLKKLGYRGIESCELRFEDCIVPREALLGEEEGLGFTQMMRGLELGRIQVAARAAGVARAAFEDALRYSQEREAFGKPIWRHQSIGNYLADMATRLHATDLLIDDAAERFDTGNRADLEAGMAKLYASEACMRITLDAMRIHGGYSYSTEFDIERYFRDAPLMIVGEGTNEIQRTVIARQLVARGGLDG